MLLLSKNNDAKYFFEMRDARRREEEKEIGRVVSRGEGAAACVERGRGGRSISERYVYDKFNWRVKKRNEILHVPIIIAW